MRRTWIAMAPLGAVALAVAAASCVHGHVPERSSSDAALPSEASPPVVYAWDGQVPPEAGPRTPVSAELLSDRVDVTQLMFAAGEMQTSGEPFAQNFAGRDLAYYDRYYIPVDQYLVPVDNGTHFFQPFTDLFGFSTAVESYEYSKYHVDMVAFQTGAGLSLASGPLVAARPGATARDKLRGRVEALLFAAGTDVAGYADVSDAGSPVDPMLPDGGNAMNDFGFPGLWPVVAPYVSFDPTMAPDTTIAHSCSTVTGYGGVIFFGSNPVNEYECAYNTLNLPNRAAQITPQIGPATLGFAAWKYALWGIDFTGRLHDAVANPVTAVAPADVARVGTRGNLVQAVAPPGAAPGVFVGSTPLEGMWGLLLVEETDNAAALALGSLMTRDGAAVGGFANVGDAIRYDYGSPLAWFPTTVAVTEDAVTPYPGIRSLSIADPRSVAVDLAALMQGYALFFGMTDPRNVAVGQQLGCQVEFGGSVFPADDGLPDGESTPHDRALGVMRTAFVDLDRIHADPATGVVVDAASITGGAIHRGATVTATSLGHVVVGLRHLLMGCNAAVSQYGAPDPDPTADALGILNSVPIHPPAADGGPTPTFSARVRSVLMTQAAFVRDVLTQPDGTVADSAALSGGKWTPSSTPDALESQGAALRVLGEAWLLSQDPSYLARAQAVGRKLFSAFWSAPGQMFRQTAGGADDVVMTPDRFAWLQQALREIYEAAWVPGDPVLDRAVLEQVIARVNKLYLNGWDDLNGDQIVQKPQECLAARLQLGEQALTGEVATSQNGNSVSAGADRESDCVWNIAFVGKGSLLASQVHFHAP